MFITFSGFVKTIGVKSYENSSTGGVRNECMPSNWKTTENTWAVL
jgi:hypothetical protein